MSTVTYANIYSSGPGDPAVEKAFEDGLASLRGGAAPIECSHRISAAALTDGARFERRDPVDPSRVVSVAPAADAEMVAQAIACAKEAQRSWRKLSGIERAKLLAPLSPNIAKRRIELAALASFEVGKTRADALAEVDECIKIIDLSIEQIETGKDFVVPHQAPSERSEALVVLRPFGVFGVIAPFNFPLAIPFGMTIAALLMGNTVVFKPSGITPACGDAFASLFEETEIPDGVINTLHGEHETGRLLVESDVDGLVFTGSAEVGIEMAHKLTAPPFVRPVIAEMGGKNPALVPLGAAGDLERAARAVARSAFGMSGQKCNACPRAVVVADVYEEFIEALVSVVGELTVGDPIDAENFTGPLISDLARGRFENAAALAARDGDVRTGGRAFGDGYFVECTVVDGLPSGHELTRE